MKTSILTSGFPNGLTNEFIIELNKYLPVDSHFVYIASDFSQPSRTQYYLDVLIQSFKDKDIHFKSINTIDHHITPQIANEYLMNADVVWIAGGPTLKQMNFIKSYNLIPSLLSREGITIGMSAGSINMAKRAILCEDKNDNPKPEIYDGIGLVNTNIEPHLNYASIDHIENIKRLSHDVAIIGLFDNSFIVIHENMQTIFGPHILFKK